MRIGVPKEVKIQEYRVAATPDIVRSLVADGHEVFIQSQAGQRSGYTDDMYLAAGAKIVSTAGEIYACDLVVKVKEPQISEVALIREGLVMFCFFHLAAEPSLAQELIARKCIAISYDTVTDSEGRLPLLYPMSEIAGRVAIQVGATLLQANNGGRGILLGGIAGTPRGKVVVIGGGASGTESVRMALGLGAQVTVIDKNLFRLRQLDALFPNGLTTLASTPGTVTEALVGADLVVGAVLLPGKKTPKVVTRAMLAGMSPGSVIVDIAIDQGGCCETSRPTTHDDPTYVVDGVTHYCVTNMPGSCPRTASQALTNATSEYIRALANKGYCKALMDDVGLRQGLNTCGGKITNRSVADDLKLAYTPAEELLCSHVT
ncbi:MAG: alanine dehydrogenase [Chlamydiales bacterium]|nr:alanine dehydrogenase [Chlamydiales bacterium]